MQMTRPVMKASTKFWFASLRVAASIIGWLSDALTAFWASLLQDFEYEFVYKSSGKYLQRSVYSRAVPHMNDVESCRSGCLMTNPGRMMHRRWRRMIHKKTCSDTATWAKGYNSCLFEESPGLVSLQVGAIASVVWLLIWAEWREIMVGCLPVPMSQGLKW